MPIWPKIKWLLSVLIELRKKSYPLVNYGIRILYLVPVLLGGWKVDIVFKNAKPLVLFDQFEITVADISDISLWMAIIFTLVGTSLIYYGIKTVRNQARKTAKVMIVSMLGESAYFPDEILYESEKIDSREPIKLGVSEDQNYIEKSIEMFNAEQMVDIYHRFILHHDCKKVFLGGRARVPLLVAYGSRFRNISANIVYFDQMHLDNKWHLLDDEDDNIELDCPAISEIHPTMEGEVGLAVCFTTQIEEHQLPTFIQGHTLFITSSKNVGRNLIKNQANLQRISGELKAIIDQLSSKANCRSIHLFLSVQSTLALEIGRNYQEGTHKPWIVYNFNASQGKYEWAIQLSRDKIEEFKKADLP